ncbi:MAG: flagellar biosynthesis protein FlhB, partial [Spirochaetales bacterium]|nr:flagellar biosynthesis protein FlhB [Spirochaetales bacterium]
IRKSREEGKVARSVDIVSGVVLLLPMLLIAFLSGYFWDNATAMMTWFISQSTALDPISGGGQVSGMFLLYMAKLVLPVLGIAFLGALIANLLQFGFLFSTKPITPDFSRLVPKFGKWLQNSLFSTQALFNIGKQVVKVVALGAIAWLNVQGVWPQLMNLISQPMGTATSFLWGLAMNIILQSAVVMLLLAVPDYMFQRWQHRESLKMSREEIKEEHKQQEGDPLIRSRLRERMREILRRNMMQNVPKADVIITNPTHYAIALQFDAKTMVAPTVLAKGQDLIAQRIKEIAAQNSVPIMENKPLARALYSAVEVGDQIPQEYWEVVANILKEVYLLSGKSRYVVG